MRVFIFISYDGGRFQGFQQQPHRCGVMDRVIIALKELGISSKPVGSSRTDSGVHALSQVIHVDIPEFWSDMSKLKNMLNRLLSPSIYVRKITVVSPEAHARFDAKARLYRYICFTGSRNPFLSDYALFVKDINLDLANKTLQLFVGTHDFGFFKKEGSETKDDIRTLYKADAYRHKNFVVFRFLGDGFLRSQVRMMIASLLAVQKGTLSLEDIGLQIDKKKRSITDVAEAGGLYLSRVYY